MNAWLWTMAGLMGIELGARLFCLALGILPTRTTAGNVIDCAILIGMLIWLAKVWE